MAVWAIAATRGLEALTMRDVAAEAGVSMGMVQHHFGTKERMLVHACRRMTEMAEEGVHELAGAAATPDSPEAVVRGVALQSLPGGDGLVGARVWQAFVARAVVDPAMAALIRESWAGGRDLVAAQLRAAGEGGRLAADVDPDRAADELLLLLDGLVVHLLVGHRTREDAVALADAHIDRLFV